MNPVFLAELGRDEFRPATVLKHLNAAAAAGLLQVERIGTDAVMVRALPATPHEKFRARAYWARYLRTNAPPSHWADMDWESRTHQTHWLFERLWLPENGLPGRTRAFVAVLMCLHMHIEGQHDPVTCDTCMIESLKEEDKPNGSSTRSRPRFYAPHE
jgi:hypothetical protein